MLTSNVPPSLHLACRRMAEEGRVTVSCGVGGGDNELSHYTVDSGESGTKIVYSYTLVNYQLAGWKMGAPDWTPQSVTTCIVSLITILISLIDPIVYISSQIIIFHQPGFS